MKFFELREKKFEKFFFGEKEQNKKKRRKRLFFFHLFQYTKNSKNEKFFT